MFVSTHNFTAMKNKDISLYIGSETQKRNDEALVQKSELEAIIKSNAVPKGLKQELTMVYFINNLLLITTQN